jgi:hypothetical protein
MKRLLLAFLVLGLSCGGADGDEPSDMSPQAVCAYYADKECAGSQRCDPWALREDFNDDGATCRERVAKSCVSRLTATGTSDTPARVVSCGKAIAQLSCEGYLDVDHWPESCSRLPGTLADGAGCIVDQQCQGGSCKFTGSRQPCGVCQTLARVGESCVDWDGCLDFLPCVEGVCTLRGKRGDRCDEASRWCASGLTCRNLDPTGVGTCQDYLPTGAKCDPNAYEVESCNFIQGDQCDFITGVCVSDRQDWSPLVGEACRSNGSCNSAAFCGSEFVCKMRPREGQPCAFNEFGQSVCLYPARCFDGRTCALHDPSVCR